MGSEGLHSSLTRETDANVALLLTFGPVIGVYFLGATAMFFSTLGKASVNNRILKRASAWFTFLPMMMSIAFIALILTHESQRLTTGDSTETTSLLYTCRAMFVLSHATPALYASPYVLNGLRVLLLHSTSLRLKLGILVKDRILTIIIVINFLLSFVGAIFFVDEPEGGLNDTICFIYKPPEYFLPMVAFYCTISMVLLYELNRHQVSDYFQIKRELVACVIVWSIFGTGYFVYLILAQEIDSLKKWQWENAPIHYIILINFCLTFHQSFSKSIQRKSTLLHFTSTKASPDTSIVQLMPVGFFQEPRKIRPTGEHSNWQDSLNINPAARIAMMYRVPCKFAECFAKGMSKRFLENSDHDSDFVCLSGSKHVHNYWRYIEEDIHGAGTYRGDLNFCLPHEKSQAEDVLHSLGVIDRNRSMHDNEFLDAVKCLVKMTKSWAQNWVTTDMVTRHQLSEIEEFCVLLSAHESTEISGKLKSRLNRFSGEHVSQSWTLQRILLNTPALHFMRIHASKSLCPELLDVFVAVRELKWEILSTLIILKVRYIREKNQDYSGRQSETNWETPIEELPMKQFVSGCNMVSYATHFLFTRSLNAVTEDNITEHGAYPRLGDGTRVKVLRQVSRIFELFIEDDSVLQVNISERTRVIVANNINSLFGNFIDLAKMPGSSRHRNSAMQANSERGSRLEELSSESLTPFLFQNAEGSETGGLQQVYRDLAIFLLEISGVFDEALEETLSVSHGNLYGQFCSLDHVKLLEVASQLASPAEGDIEKGTSTSTLTSTLTSRQ